MTISSDVFVHSTVCLQERAAEKVVFLVITLQIGFMNNGEIKAADVEYYINGGCTPDESELVNTPSPKSPSGPFFIYINICLNQFHKRFKLNIKFETPNT